MFFRSFSMLKLLHNQVKNAVRLHQMTCGKTLVASEPKPALISSLDFIAILLEGLQPGYLAQTIKPVKDDFQSLTQIYFQS